ncbi:UTRA domain-containing protein [Vibrio sp.]|uniref:UTRA domain-containing protein n=1 Tax=Vibrio sp. TaxID=678 RepID=UPI003D11C2BC
MQYVKIKDALVEQISSGLLAPRQKLPPERKLAESFNTTRVTLREALSLLEAEGKIFREDRRGWFISPTPLVYDLRQNQGFTLMAVEQTRRPTTELLSAQSVLANKQASQMLRLPPFSDVYCINRVRYLEDRPVAYVTHYIRPDNFQGLLDCDLSASLSELFQQQFSLVLNAIRYRISTSSLLGETAQALRATAGSPATVVEKVCLGSNGEAVIGTVEFWRHDALSIESMSEVN